MRVPAASLYRSGGFCGPNGGGNPGFVVGGHLHHHHTTYTTTTHTHARAHNEVDEEISRIAQSLSQISHDQLGHELHDHFSNGLQVKDTTSFFLFHQKSRLTQSPFTDLGSLTTAYHTG